MKCAFLLIAILLTHSAHAAAPTLDPNFCQHLVAHTPDADVAYQPGIDVHGKPVAPADLADSPQIKLPDVITIPITVDILTMLHLPAGQLAFPPGAGTEAVVGNLTVEGNRVSFNGQPLTSQQQENLSVLCMHPDGRAIPPPLDLKPQTP